MKYWFYLETDTLISCNESAFLLYNTLSGKSHKQLIDKAFLYLLEKGLMERKCALVLSDDEINQNNLKDIITTVRNLYFGDLIPINDNNSIAPYPFPSRLDFQEKKIFENSESRKTKNLIECIAEIFLYPISFDERCSRGISPYFDATYFDDSFCVCPKYISFLQGISNKRLFLLNLPFSKNAMLSLDILWSQSIFQLVIFHSHMLNYISGHVSNVNLVLYVDSYDDIRLIESKIDSAIKDKNKVSLSFLVRNLKENVIVEKIIDNCGIEDTRIIPFYTKDNLDFFEKYVYLDETDILKNVMTKREIFAKQLLNTNDYGRLLLFPNGDVYGNLNANKMGNIYEEPVCEILLNELFAKQSWFRVRNEEPCCRCLYQWLCPSPSNYEFMIGKPNLCCIEP